MNIKLHTPKSLKSGSGMSSWRQFLLSLLATTVSIALTFGTAAIIDNNKKQSEKREIVMMVMYDMYNSLQAMQKADSMLLQAMEIQKQIAQDSTKFNDLRFNLARLMPTVGYTETTEHIFSSSIETINTVGNVLFTENVAKFYQDRRYFKTMVCDSIWNDVANSSPLQSIERTLNFGFFDYAMMCNSYLTEMQHLFSQCQQMMNVTDEEIQAYSKKRQQMETDMKEADTASASKQQKLMQLQKEITKAKKNKQ
jgi:ABC-type dipeptide/oligopeptide/nickel transport system ATPase subunit